MSDLAIGEPKAGNGAKETKRILAEQEDVKALAAEIIVLSQRTQALGEAEERHTQANRENIERLRAELTKVQSELHKDMTLAIEALNGRMMEAVTTIKDQMKVVDARLFGIYVAAVATLATFVLSLIGGVVLFLIKK